MIVPMIHRNLRREDLVCLVAEIAAADPLSAREAAHKLECGQIDLLLDLPGALRAVRGRGGTPGALPLPILWYVPVRALLRGRGEENITIADFTATIPVAFVSSRSARRFGLGEPALTTWTRTLTSLPTGSVAQAQRAAYCAALAIWWAGCFPERVNRSGGAGMLRAYIDFAAGAFERAARILHAKSPDTSSVYADASDKAEIICTTLRSARENYLGKDKADAELKRLLKGLG
jgi:hypothetical protein